jgi:hypothetical protein
MSSANAVAAWIVADRHANSAKGPALDAFLETLSIAIGPVTVQQARLARTTYHTWGKGRPPAGLHFGDCCAYALAKATDLPRLFKAAGHRYARPSRPSASRLSLGIEQLWYDRNHHSGSFPLASHGLAGPHHSSVTRHRQGKHEEKAGIRGMRVLVLYIPAAGVSPALVAIQRLLDYAWNRVGRDNYAGMLS